MRRLMKGLVFGAAAIALLGGAGAANADAPGEALQGAPRLRESKAANRLHGRFQVGGSWKQNENDAGDTLENWQVNFGGVGYYRGWFLRGDGGLSVSDDEFLGADVGSSDYSFALGHEFAAGRDLTWGPWMGYGNTNLSFDGVFGDRDEGISGPFVGIGFNWTPSVKGKSGRLSVFGGFRYHFLSEASDDLNAFGVEGCDGYEFGGGFRYQFTNSWYATLAASWRRDNLSTFLGDADATQVNAFLNVGTYIR